MYETVTPEEIQERIRSRVDTTILTTEGSFFELHSKPVAYVLSELYHKLDAQIPISFVDETSGKYIDKRAGEFGITRKPGYKATVTLTVTGTMGCRIPAGTPFQTEDGLRFLSLTDGQIGLSGTIDVPAVAAEIGVLYNLPAGSIVRTVQYVSKLDTVTNVKPAEGGMDIETDQALLARLYAYWRDPATSGNRYDYEHWAMSVNGVGAARCVEIWNGPGTVKVIIADMQIQPVTEQLRKQVADYIETVRPVCPEVTVVSAQGVDISIAAQVKLSDPSQLTQVKEDFQVALQTYIRETAFDNPFLSYNRIAYLLMSVDGVRDYTQLTVNEAEENIDLPLGQVPVLKQLEVTLSAS